MKYRCRDIWHPTDMASTDDLTVGATMADGKKTTTGDGPKGAGARMIDRSALLAGHPLFRELGREVLGQIAPTQPHKT